MTLISYNEELVYNGQEFHRIENFNFDGCIVQNIKKLFDIFIKKKIKFNIEKIVGLEYMNSSVSFDQRSIPSYNLIHRILDSQKQNLSKEIKYVPEYFQKQYLQEEYSSLQNLYKFLDIPDYIRYHNSISYIFSKIEQKNGYPINFKVYGTKTGRVTHNFVSKTKKDIRAFFGENVIEFDFTAFEVANMRTFFNMPFLEDPYNIEGLDRKAVKEMLISKLYGMSDENLLKNHNYPQIIEYINREYHQIFEFKKTLIEQANQFGYIKIPISGLRIFYTEKFEQKVLNNFFQALSADIMKLKLFMLYQIFKKDKDVTILFPVHDSIYIKVKDKEKIEKIQHILESEIKANQQFYKHKVHVKELK